MKCGVLVWKPWRPSKKRKQDEEDEELEAILQERHAEILAERAAVEAEAKPGLKPGDLKKQPCNLNRTWRQDGTLQVRLARNMSITEYLRALYWFLEPVPFHTVIKQSGIAEKTYRQLCYQLRTMMFEKMQEVQGTLPLLGGRGKAVCIDETYFTKKKRCRGGWVGHVTLGHKTVVLGMCEIDLASRRCTGNVRLIVLQGCTGTPSAAVLRKHIKEHVLDGSLIFTDSLQSYKFLSREGYVHRAINHKRKEFSRTETLYGEEVNISTNSVEGLFGRVKQFNRRRDLKRICKGDYGVILAQFLWEQHYTSKQTEWHKAPLWPLLALIKEYQGKWGMQRAENELQVTEAKKHAWKGDGSEDDRCLAAEFAGYREQTKTIPEQVPASVHAAVAAPPKPEEVRQRRDRFLERLESGEADPSQDNLLPALHVGRDADVDPAEFEVGPEDFHQEASDDDGDEADDVADVVVEDQDDDAYLSHLVEEAARAAQAEQRASKRPRVQADKVPISVKLREREEMDRRFGSGDVVAATGANAAPQAVDAAEMARRTRELDGYMAEIAQEAPRAKAKATTKVKAGPKAKATSKANAAPRPSEPRQRRAPRPPPRPSEPRQRQAPKPPPTPQEERGPNQAHLMEPGGDYDVMYYSGWKPGVARRIHVRNFAGHLVWVICAGKDPPLRSYCRADFGWVRPVAPEEADRRATRSRTRRVL